MPNFTYQICDRQNQDDSAIAFEACENKWLQTSTLPQRRSANENQIKGLGGNKSGCVPQKTHEDLNLANYKVVDRTVAQDAT